MKRRWGFCVLGMLLTLPAAGQGFWLKNTDPSAVFSYWTVDAVVPVSAGVLLPLLPAAPGGLHRVAPGERVRVVLTPGQALVGVFVPWTEPLSYLSPLTGGFILGAEAPLQGTVLIDRPSFAAANRGRLLEGRLQEWGLVPPRWILDGRGADWDSTSTLLEWGPAYQPGQRTWPAGWPKIQRLQVVDREGALWLRLVADRPWIGLPSGVSVSLGLRRSGALIEWPLTGSDPTVWSWTSAADPQAVGRRLVSADGVEAWIPWDRWTEVERQLWRKASATWVLMVEENGTLRNLELARFSWEELP